jgi:chromosome segregation ATPase
MNRLNRSLLAVALSGGFCGGIGLVQAGPLNGSQIGYQNASQNGSQPARPLADEEHWKYKHMHHAMASLREARKELDLAEDVFHGHKQDAIDHVEAAIKTIEAGLKEQKDETAAPAALPAPTKLEEERFPHVKHAIDRLKDAKTELEASEPIFAGHRDEAISHTDKAIKQLEDAVHDAG